MEEDGLDNGHNQETFGFLVMNRGTGTLGSVKYEAIATLSNVNEEPYLIRFVSPFVGVPGLFGSIATFNGGDPSHLRQRTPVSPSRASIFIEEESCTDAEVAHPHPEVVHIIAIDQTDPFAQVETGTATSGNTLVTIGYEESYINPVVFAGIPTAQGSGEVAIRITRIGDSDFDMYADVPNHAAGEGAVCGTCDHTPETFAWMITESGQVGNLQAGTQTSGCQVTKHASQRSFCDFISNFRLVEGFSKAGTQTT